jgi:hypothetical protein
VLNGKSEEINICHLPWPVDMARVHVAIFQEAD